MLVVTLVHSYMETGMQKVPPTMLSRWRRSAPCREAHSGPSESHCTGCRYLRTAKDSDVTQTNAERATEMNPLSLIASLCLSIKIGAAPRDATVSTRNRQLCLREIRAHWETSHDIRSHPVLHPKQTLQAHFLQMSPIPSTGWQRPAEDSPCVRKNRTGLCFLTA